MSRDILIVDDEADIRDLISDVLKDEGYTTRIAADSMKALEAVDEFVPAVIVLDIWLQGSELDGLGVLEVIKRKYPYLPVIMISGHGTVETAVNAIKLGAYDYIEKPFTQDKLCVLVKRASEAGKLWRENAELKKKVEGSLELIGSSSCTVQLRSAVDKVASTSSRVMIFGAAGTGKETIARLLHQKSRRASEPFVILNASTISADKAEIELFGSDEKGDVFANSRKIGVLERAHGGTLFIDEVGDLPIIAQSKLLRFLQDHSFERSGSNRIVKVDVRVISSSSRDLNEEIKKGRFREDLFYRLNVVPLKAVPLSERREDIPLLCQYFLRHAAEFSGLPSRIIGDDALVAMQAYSWPGNIRQLRNVIEWLLIMAPGGKEVKIQANMLPPEVLSDGALITTPETNSELMAMELREAREVFERQYLAAQINRFNGNISRTSAFVGMERSALHRKLKSLNINALPANDGE